MQRFRFGSRWKKCSMIILSLLMVTCLSLFYACNDDDPSPTSDSGDEVVTVSAVSSTAIDTFAAVETDVVAVTPRVDFTAANTQLDEWVDWRDPSDDDPEDSMTQLTVLEKLLSDSAESIYAPVEFLSDIMYVIDAIDTADSGVWDEAGTISVSVTNPVTAEPVEMSISVSLVEGTLALPTFFQDKVSESIQTSMVASFNRIISFTFLDDTTGWETVVALGEDDDYYYLIASSAHETLNETQTFVAYKEKATETMTLFYASADDDSEGNGVYTKWSGNTSDDWFAIAQVTGGHQGNQEVVGGGTIEGSGTVAFKSRNNDDDTGDSTDVYYIADLTLANIEDGTDPGVAPVLGEPDSGTGSIEYLIESNEKCLGWLGQNEGPLNRAEIVWSPIE